MMDIIEGNEKYGFYKEKATDTIYQVYFYDQIGTLAVSFDKKKILYLFRDYPHAFSKEEKEIFDRENPYWRDFFAGVED